MHHSWFGHFRQRSHVHGIHVHSTVQRELFISQYSNRFYSITFLALDFILQGKIKVVSYFFLWVYLSTMKCFCEHCAKYLVLKSLSKFNFWAKERTCLQIFSCFFLLVVGFWFLLGGGGGIGEGRGGVASVGIWLFLAGVRLTCFSFPV